MATEGDLRAAEIAAAEARTDAKIVRIEGKLDLVLSKIDSIRDVYSEKIDGIEKTQNARVDALAETQREIRIGQRHVIANLWVVFAALTAIIVGAIAAAPVIFDLGMKVHDLIEKKATSSTNPG
jgi:hypothetical protein